MRRLLKNRKLCISIICAVLFIFLQAEKCGFREIDDTLVKVKNESSYSVLVTFYGEENEPVTQVCGEDSTSEYINLGAVNYIKTIVTPLGDWKKFAEQKRDRLLAALEKAKETNNQKDIEDIATQLREVQQKIEQYKKTSGKVEVNIVGDGGKRRLIIRNSESGNPITVNWNEVLVGEGE